MGFWSILGVAVLSNGAVLSGAIWFIKRWLDSKFDKRLAEFKSELNKKSFVSNSLYKNRESTILEFDLAWRGLVGCCHDVVYGDMKHQSKFDRRWGQMRGYYSQLQNSYFRGNLVYDEELKEVSKEMYECCLAIENKTAWAITMLAGGHNCSLDDVKPDPDFKWDVIQCTSVETEIKILLSILKDKNIEKWESGAREALLQIKIP